MDASLIFCGIATLVPIAGWFCIQACDRDARITAKILAREARVRQNARYDPAILLRRALTDG